MILKGTGVVKSGLNWPEHLPGRRKPESVKMERKQSQCNRKVCFWSTGRKMSGGKVGKTDRPESSFISSHYLTSFIAL